MKKRMPWEKIISSFKTSSACYFTTIANNASNNAKPDPRFFLNMGGFDDEAITGEIVDSVLLQPPNSEGWTTVIRKIEKTARAKHVGHRRYF